MPAYSRADRDRFAAITGAPLPTDRPVLDAFVAAAFVAADVLAAAAAAR